MQEETKLDIQNNDDAKRTVPIFIDSTLVSNEHSVKSLESLLDAITTLNYSPRLVATSDQAVHALSEFYYMTLSDWRTLPPSDAVELTAEAARSTEIHTWLSTHKVDFWLAFDPYMLSLNELNVVLCLNALAPNHLQEALEKFEKQQQRRLREKCTGRFTDAEWEILKTSSLDLQVLRKDTCPLWIVEAARAYVRATTRKLEQNRPSTRNACCIIT